jgi:LPXTG-motif cell wall-anchored protein
MAGGSGGVGGTAEPVAPQGTAVGGVGGNGGSGGDGGAGGAGGDGGAGFVSTGALTVFGGDVSARPGTPGVGGSGGAAGTGGAGGAGGATLLGIPVPGVAGADGADGVAGADGALGAAGAGFALTSTSVIGADTPLSAVVPQAAATGILHANNGTSQQWSFQASTLGQALDALAASGTDFPTYAAHTLDGWSATANGGSLLAADTDFGSSGSVVDVYAQWSATSASNTGSTSSRPVTVSSASLAATGSDAVPWLLGGGLLLAAGGALVVGRRRFSTRG